MTYKELEETFNNETENFKKIKKNIEKKIVNFKYSQGEYFNILPFSYQRLGLKEGKIIEDTSKIKFSNNLYRYGFDEEGKIIEVKESIDIEDQYYHEFYMYEKRLIISRRYTNNDELQNISYYFLDIDDIRIYKMISKGRYGGGKENYLYSDNNLLMRIDVIQIDRKGNEVNPYKEIFSYNQVGKLETITKIFENGDSDIIYK